MDHESLTSNPLNQQLRKLIPNRGMPIDVPTWTEAHEYHSYKLKHHNIGSHNAGIVTGLEVTETDPRSGSITVHPGIAIDPLGNQIVLQEKQSLDISETESDTVYIALKYGEDTEEDHIILGHDTPLARFAVEGNQVYTTSEALEQASLELARIHLTEQGVKISNPRNALAPNHDEIDQRYRKKSGSGRLGHINIGLLELPDVGHAHPPHTVGALLLIQSINALTNYSASLVDCSDFKSVTGTVDLLLLTGSTSFAVDDALTERISAYLSGSGMIFGEVCNHHNAYFDVEDENNTQGTAESNLGFRTSINELAENLGKEFMPVPDDHLMFHSVYPYSHPPDATSGPGVVVIAENFIYSDSDYGCLWEGKEKENRSTIRDAIEFAINIAVVSISRLRTQVESSESD